MEIGGRSESKDIPFFPSLEYLDIWRLERLKGWWGGVSESDSSRRSKSHWLPPFSRLSTLKINYCPELLSFPPCPSLKSLQVRYSKNLFGGNLDISNCSSLENLEISECRRLTSVLGALEHLTALESLSLRDTSVEVDLDDIPWSSLRQNLRFLQLEYFCTMQTLPMEMRYLSALENLSIGYSNALEGLPEWISCLSSLHSLTIVSCSNLKSLGTIQYITSLQKLNIHDCGKLREECQRPSGKEWPKIQHIPDISITDTVTHVLR